MYLNPSNGDISRQQQGVQGRVNAERLWVQLAEKLNSSGGGVIKSLEKWKKVWADWKTKTKKKALLIRRQGQFTKHTLTPTEVRVLGTMGQAGIEVGGLEEPPSDEVLPLPPHFKNMHVSRNDNTQEIMMDYIPIHDPSNGGGIDTPTPSQPSSSHENPAEQMRAPILPRRRISRYGVATANQFLAIEQRRLRLEEERERNNHKREMERLRLESKRIEVEERRNDIFNRLASIADNLTQILPQLRPPISGVPSNPK